MNPETDTSKISIWLFGIATVIAALLYLPGLAGSFMFDDSGVLLQNPAIHVVHPDLSDWVAAATSFGGNGLQSRWLGMLTFAVNHYLTGMDPYWFKLTNLAIHLLNGLLVFLALRALFDLYFASNATRQESRRFDASLAAAVLAALWLVLPINLTGVLYISQRLESLASTFVFLGLWWYLRARLAAWERRRGYIGLWLSLGICTLLGLQVKEPAVLLPLYAFTAEFVITRGKDRDGKWYRPTWLLFSTVLAVPFACGLAWLAYRFGHPKGFGRDFDLVQRLMTECRVMFDYMTWTLAPSLDSLTLYHDDVAVSKGLLDPPSTLAALMGIIILLGAAFWQWSKRPLFTLGIFWFFGGHLLTGTVIPLILVFEHRNYFPSIGLLLATSSLLVLEGPRLRARSIAIGASCVFVFYSFTTLMRSMEWSSPLQLAASDAAKRPESSASQYEYARILLTSTQNGNPEPMRTKAFEILKRMAIDPKAEATHNQLLIVYSAELGRPIDPQWWESMIEKLRSRPPTSTEVTAISALLRCFDKDFCFKDTTHLAEIFAAATAHEGGYPQLYLAYGRFALNYLNDRDLAERQFREALRQGTLEPDAVMGLAAVLIQNGEFDEADSEIERLRPLNIGGALDGRISELRNQVIEARKSRGSAPAG